MSSPLHPFAVRLLAALGAASAAACGGIAVIDAGGGAGVGGTGGAGGTGGTGGQTCDVPSPPPGFLAFDTCLGLGGPCPAKEAVDPALIAETLPDCTSDPTFCWCDKTIATVSCAYEKGGACCYVGTYSTQELCEGRPFVVDGAPRTACAVERADWGGGDGLEGDEALAAAWTRDALAEHASIASFARHALELLAVGAPAGLVEGALRAMGDEIEHARLCFALASRHAGRSLGPGALDAGGALEGPLDLAAVAAATARDGCVNETISALVAAAMRDAATDPEARAALERIADDEARHAELAWRFVGWAIATGGAPVRRAVDAAFAAARFTARGDGAGALAAHGRLTTDEVARVAADALDAVVRPCAAALLRVEHVGASPVPIGGTLR